MPFMKGPAPVRRSIEYLTKPHLLLKPYIRIFTLNYNRRQETHSGAKQFVFWHLPQIQFNNPEVQVITIRDLTPTPFIRIWLNSGRELLMDIDRQSKDEIYQRVVKGLCKTQEEVQEEAQASGVQENPANFGTGCSRHCMCELPGQIPCPSVVPLPFTWRGKYKYGFAELDESKKL